MRLLIATDHRYHAGPDGTVLDTYCFDRAFFDDYRAIFPEVVVAARLRTDAPPATARRADGDGVSFVPLPDVRGLSWMASPAARHLRDLRTAVADADAVCVRLPSRSGRVAAALARSLGKPLMFELVGDPAASLSSADHGRLRGLFGQYDGLVTRRIARSATAGSYVSVRHLQERYPVRSGTPTASISSIRLPEANIVAPRVWATRPDPLRVALVASLVPVKRHDTLLRGVAEARRLGTPVHLDLVGDGPERAALADLAATLGVSDHVTFHGHLSGRGAIDAVLDAADLFVMTSASEGMPRSMIEAFARGTPALGTRVGGIAELLPAERTVPAGDWAALGALLTRSADPADLTAASAAAVATARTFAAPALSARRQALLAHLAQAASRRSLR